MVNKIKGDYMKKIIFIFSFICATANGETLMTSCPVSYTTIKHDDVIIAENSCPDGYTQASSGITSCITNPTSNDCWLFAPAGTLFDDEYGQFKFNDVCTFGG